MDAKEKAVLAAGLILAWAGLAVWQWGLWKEPVRVPLTNVTGLASDGRSARGNTNELRVNLELLASARSQREATFTEPRNIFAVPSPDGTLPVSSEVGQVEEQESVSGQDVLQQATAVELAQYRYLGFLRMGESRFKNNDVAVLSKNEEVVVVKVGDRVEDHLILKAITPEGVTIRDTGTSIDQTVPLSEEPPAP